MNIPNDPAVLLSYINTKLRDYYPSLDALCKDMDLDKEQIVKKLDMIGYKYKPGKKPICLIKGSFLLNFYCKKCRIML